MYAESGCGQDCEFSCNTSTTDYRRAHVSCMRVCFLLGRRLPTADSRYSFSGPHCGHKCNNGTTNNEDKMSEKKCAWEKNGADTWFPFYRSRRLTSVRFVTSAVRNNIWGAQSVPCYTPCMRDIHSRHRRQPGLYGCCRARANRSELNKLLCIIYTKDKYNM